MVEVGDTAPDFTAPLANGQISKFTFSEALPEAAPVVLAFFPGSFTAGCSTEMSTFQKRLEAFEGAGATLLGVSADLPFAQNQFRNDLGLDFGLVSDSSRDLIEAYDVRMDFGHIGVEDVAKRAVFVVDDDGTVTYAWVSDDPAVEPDYDEVIAAVQDAA